VHADPVGGGYERIKFLGLREFDAELQENTPVGSCFAENLEEVHIAECGEQCLDFGRGEHGVRDGFEELSVGIAVAVAFFDTIRQLSADEAQLYGPRIALGEVCILRIFREDNECLECELYAGGVPFDSGEDTVGKRKVGEFVDGLKFHACPFVVAQCARSGPQSGTLSSIVCMCSGCNHDIGAGARGAKEKPAQPVRTVPV